MLSEKQLRNAVKELNDLLGVDMDVQFSSVEKITETLREAIVLIQPGDTVEDSTLAVIQEITPLEDLTLERVVTKTKEKYTIAGVLGIKVENAEGEGKKDEKDDTSTLVEDIKAASRLRDLKDIATEYDQFKAIRGKLSSFKTVDDLREEMLGVLTGKEEAPAPVEKPGKDSSGRKEKVENPTKEKTPKEPKEKKEKGKKGPGIIETIAHTIEKAGKKGVSKEDILKVLVEKFPDKEEKSMKATINVQVPGRISKERFPVKKVGEANYAKA